MECSTKRFPFESVTCNSTNQDQHAHPLPDKDLPISRKKSPIQTVKAVKEYAKKNFFRLCGLAFSIQTFDRRHFLFKRSIHVRGIFYSNVR